MNNYILLNIVSGVLSCSSIADFERFKNNNSAVLKVLVNGNEQPAHVIMGRATDKNNISAINAALKQHRLRNTAQTKEALLAVITRLAMGEKIDKEAADKILRHAGLGYAEVAGAGVASPESTAVANYVYELQKANAITPKQVEQAFKLGNEKGLAELKEIYPMSEVVTEPVVTANKKKPTYTGVPVEKTTTETGDTDAQN